MPEPGRLGVNGRRGTFLLSVAIVHAAIGMYVLALARAGVVGDPTGIAGPVPFVRELGVPLWAAAVPWFLTAAAGAVAAFVRPPGRDSFGFVAVASMHSAWALVYVIGWALGARTPGGPFLAVVFAAVSVAIISVSGMVSVGAIRLAVRTSAKARSRDR